jgi:hypothetical protein
VIALTLVGGLILALIGVHKAMVNKTLANENDVEGEEDPQNIKPDESFDPILVMEKKNCQYWALLGGTFPLPPCCLYSNAAPCQYC